ncbi:hypothetical protein LTR37_016485 [Vermiconidia calcicola]|uniref:Uncharacterized protein n=1 Tax=Vermiconidia calcicola TaxID=1690605 RepID=A0ACC3MNE7_9PEZI|nr:hypothetical protein LTR37_016485 [Vermiconidia calcicola]
MIGWESFSAFSKWKLSCVRKIHFMPSHFFSNHGTFEFTYSIPQIWITFPSVYTRPTRRSTPTTTELINTHIQMNKNVPLALPAIANDKFEATIEWAKKQKIHDDKGRYLNNACDSCMPNNVSFETRVEMINQMKKSAAEAAARKAAEDRNAAQKAAPTAARATRAEAETEAKKTTLEASNVTNDTLEVPCDGDMNDGLTEEQLHDLFGENENGNLLEDEVLDALLADALYSDVAGDDTLEGQLSAAFNEEAHSIDLLDAGFDDGAVSTARSSYLSPSEKQSSPAFFNNGMTKRTPSRQGTPTTPKAPSKKRPSKPGLFTNHVQKQRADDAKRKAKQSTPSASRQSSVASSVSGAAPSTIESERDDEEADPLNLFKIPKARATAEHQLKDAYTRPATRPPAEHEKSQVQLEKEKKAAEKQAKRDAAMKAKKEADQKPAWEKHKEFFDAQDAKRAARAEEAAARAKEATGFLSKDVDEDPELSDDEESLAAPTKKIIVPRRKQPSSVKRASNDTPTNENSDKAVANDITTIEGDGQTAHGTAADSGPTSTATPTTIQENGSSAPTNSTELQAGGNDSLPTPDGTSPVPPAAEISTPTAPKTMSLKEYAMRNAAKAKDAKATADQAAGQSVAEKRKRDDEEKDDAPKGGSFLTEQASQASSEASTTNRKRDDATDATSGDEMPAMKKVRTQAPEVQKPVVITTKRKRDDGNDSTTVHDKPVVKKVRRDEPTVDTSSIAARTDARPACANATTSNLNGEQSGANATSTGHSNNDAAPAPSEADIGGGAETATNTSGNARPMKKATGAKRVVNKELAVAGADAGGTSTGVSATVTAAAGLSDASIAARSIDDSTAANAAGAEATDSGDTSPHKKGIARPVKKASGVKRGPNKERVVAGPDTPSAPSSNKRGRDGDDGGADSAERPVKKHVKTSSQSQNTVYIKREKTTANLTEHTRESGGLRTSSVAPAEN